MDGRDTIGIPSVCPNMLRNERLPWTSEMKKFDQ